MIDNNSQNAKGYNLYNFEANFKSYLLAGNQNKDTVKNYLSDYRHFCGFVMRQSQNSTEEIDLIAILSIKLISNYKEYLVDSHLPRLTINRRLSTIRKFCTFCISQGWMTENPGKDVVNVALDRGDLNQNKAETVIPQRTASNTNHELLDLVFEYENTLQKIEEKQIKKELGNVNEFLSIISAL